MNIELVASPASELSSNLLIIGVFEECEQLPEFISEDIKDFLFKKENFKAKFAQFYKFASPKCCNTDKILFAGLGKKEEFSLNKLRELGAKAIKQALSMTNIENVVFSFANIKETDFSKCDLAQVLTEGLLIGEYNFDKYKTKKDDEEEIKNIQLSDICEKCAATARQGVEKGKIIAGSINFARELINEQPNIVTPERIAQEAKEIQGVETRVFEKEEIQNMGMGAFLAVSQGGGHSPKFIHMKYTPENPKKKIAIIGKSITFDSGGVDGKPPA